jgi:WD40 repeat protein
VSDDCLLKIWRLKTIKAEMENKGGSLDPMLTLRGHTDSIVSVTGPSESALKTDAKQREGGSNKLGQLIFTASLDGTIKAWLFPDKL